jgi:hypothetical protein
MQLLSKFFDIVLPFFKKSETKNTFQAEIPKEIKDLIFFERDLNSKNHFKKTSRILKTYTGKTNIEFVHFINSKLFSNCVQDFLGGKDLSEIAKKTQFSSATLRKLMLCNDVRCIRELSDMAIGEKFLENSPNVALNEKLGLRVGLSQQTLYFLGRSVSQISRDAKQN